MDPTANLKEQLEIVKRINAGKGTIHDLGRLAELIEALDQWLRNGGFLPRQWGERRAVQSTFPRLMVGM